MDDNELKKKAQERVAAFKKAAEAEKAGLTALMEETRKIRAGSSAVVAKWRDALKAMIERYNQQLVAANQGEKFTLIDKDGALGFTFGPFAVVLTWTVSIAIDAHQTVFSGFSTRVGFHGTDKTQQVRFARSFEPMLANDEVVLKEQTGKGWTSVDPEQFWDDAAGRALSGFRK